MQRSARKDVVLGAARVYTVTVPGPKWKSSLDPVRFDQNTRFLGLAFVPASGGLNVTIPSDPNVVPPGHYMLFILNGAGTPSVASIVTVAGLTLIATVRVGANKEVNAHFFDFEDGRRPGSETRKGTGSETWQHLIISRDFGPSRQRDYFAVGISQPLAGDYVHIRDVRIVRAVLPAEVRVPLPNGMRARTR